MSIIVGVRQAMMVAAGHCLGEGEFENLLKSAAVLQKFLSEAGVKEPLILASRHVSAAKTAHLFANQFGQTKARVKKLDELFYCYNSSDRRRLMSTILKNTAETKQHTVIVVADFVLIEDLSLEFGRKGEFPSSGGWIYSPEEPPSKRLLFFGPTGLKKPSG